ncbi:uncharacterized protein N0V89_005132 [Didymosphaeria variabile]|uniref:Glutathione S-transferase UstS-like C-terminal domain-containing protein n=1 Tax=Didymosphaeria variabile TaxID=1932322 RepID=A0A9W8XMB0_9PLEO|nr:uncharacterized protein N0V89_005132 [Didymosphaeria variabile]KAJ4353403.1 hypothetical protein N0V89_005132 [Didymosphaeria variabile]
MVLNIKGIDYKTQWVEYPDLVPTLKALAQHALVKPIIFHLLPKVPKNLLSEVSAEYFNLTREESFGKPLPQLEAEAKEEAWEEMKPIAKDVGDLLREKGAVLLGRRVSFDCE